MSNFSPEQDRDLVAAGFVKHPIFDDYKFTSTTVWVEIFVSYGLPNVDALKEVPHIQFVQPGDDGAIPATLYYTDITDAVNIALQLANIFK